MRCSVLLTVIAGLEHALSAVGQGGWGSTSLGRGGVLRDALRVDGHGCVCNCAAWMVTTVLGG